jgi:Major tropism determinant N-terminal domain/Collagen triple helix repeat (20 copies)
MPYKIQIRRGTAAQWTAANPVLLIGELGFETDTNLIKAGNGSTAWTSLTYYTGAVGATGATGATGAQGIQGIQGATGSTGATGASGTNGTNGATGAQGVQGIQGATGASGAIPTNYVISINGITGTVQYIVDYKRGWFLS